MIIVYNVITRSIIIGLLFYNIVSIVDGPSLYTPPSMQFDGRTSVNFSDQTDSCFGNFDLCADGWTISFWLKSSDLSTEQVIMDSHTVNNTQPGFDVHVPGDGSSVVIHIIDWDKSEVFEYLLYHHRFVWFSFGLIAI